MTFRLAASTLLMTAALSGLPPSRVSAAQAPSRVSAAQAPSAPAPAVADVDRLSAESTRERLRDLLGDYPPSLAQVLRLDPTLLSNPAYLAPYPGLAAYLAQHPEVAHNPSYFIGDFGRFGQGDSRRQTIDAVEESLAGLAFFLFFMTALAAATSVGRSILEHRRWMHATRIQTDAHTKLVDRLASNEDLLAYVQSAAGQRFLSAAAIPVDPDSRSAGLHAPLGRIFTSVQLGIVAAFGGAGLWIAKNRVIEEVAQPLHVIAILAMALGLGFVLSALLSYGLSRQLGLLKTSADA
jgi:hypothetical protein